MRERAEVPFAFCGCVELRQMLGLRADDEKELADLLDEVPIESIYYHTHSCLLRTPFMVGLHPNDFATWVAVQVRDRVLGERLAVIDPFYLEGLEPLREEILSIIDDHLSRMSVVPRVVFGEPFYFKQCRVVEVLTGLEAWTLREFRNMLADVDVSVIYFHLFNTRMRLNRGEGDFSIWLREHLEIPELADTVRAINPYLGSLERIRSRLLMACDDFLKKGRDR